jgi:hypothetical protein
VILNCITVNLVLGNKGNSEVLGCPAATARGFLTEARRRNIMRLLSSPRREVESQKALQEGRYLNLPDFGGKNSDISSLLF